MLIIFSQQRNDEGNTLDKSTVDIQQSAVSQLAVSQLAEHFRSAVVSIPFLYDLQPFGRIIPQLRKTAAEVAAKEAVPKEVVLFFSSLPVQAAESLLASLEIPFDFCFNITDKTTAEIIAETETALQNRNIGIPAKDTATNNSADNSAVENLTEPVSKRWYPVICRSECTGCLECVNFCLFGVYSVDENNLPFVDLPDHCRPGCPACSRICPPRAIIFPMHEDADISGRSDSGRSDSGRIPEKAVDGNAGLDELTALIDEMN
jgi:Pyruvate/2-oxoacid:ferredoxin oxidoreductase delta subunit